MTINLLMAAYRKGMVAQGMNAIVNGGISGEINRPEYQGAKR